MKKLSVIMSVYNNASTLQQAINSILKQTFKDFQFIIVNDASTDQSEEILNQLSKQDKRIKLINNRAQLGLTKSLNKALKSVKTKYIARMDGDDIALPKRFEKQIKYLNEHPQIGLLGTAAYLINNQGKQIGLKRYSSDNKVLKKKLLHYCPFIHSTWMLRRSVLLEAGEYNQNFPYAQDYELILRIASKFSTANLPEPLLKYRVDSSAAISLKNLKQQEWLALKARFLALINYSYPLSESWKLIKPALSFLVPVFIKKIIYRQFYWK